MAFVAASKVEEDLQQARREERGEQGQSEVERVFESRRVMPVQCGG